MYVCVCVFSLPCTGEIKWILIILLRYLISLMLANGPSFSSLAFSVVAGCRQTGMRRQEWWDASCAMDIIICKEREAGARPAPCRCNPAGRRRVLSSSRSTDKRSAAAANSAIVWHRSSAAASPGEHVPRWPRDHADGESPPASLWNI